MKPRTRARRIALQALYEIDLTEHPAAIVLAERLKESSLDERLAKFAASIVMGIVPIRAELDQFISEHAPEWPIDQVSNIDRNLLRIALWEFAVSGDTPIKVAINEAIELAKMFGSESTPRFINGVLGSLAARQNEIGLAIQSVLEAENPGS